MPLDFVALAVSIGLTLVGLVITALIWSRAKWKTVIWWLGASFLPVAIFMLGLVPQVVGAWWTLSDWWRGLTFNILESIGIGVAIASVALMLISRVIPATPRKRAVKKDAGATPGLPSPVLPSSAPQPPAPASQATPSDNFDEITEILRRRGIE